MTQIDIGIRRDHVLTFTVPMQHERTATSAQIRRFIRNCRRGLERCRGCRAWRWRWDCRNGSATTAFHDCGSAVGAEIDKQPQTIFMPVTPGYYPTTESG